MMDALVGPPKSTDILDAGYITHLTKSLESIGIGVLEASQ